MNPNPSSIRARRPRAGFTFAEVLAALLFMAIVIPVAVEGVRIANLAGQVADRKSAAVRIAQNYLNELKATGQWQQGTLNGVVHEGVHEYRWNARVEPWNQIQRAPVSLRLLTVQVSFAVQGRPFDVRVATLIDTSTS
jgi:hypothetical protein